jgi:hypothetical protein
MPTCVWRTHRRTRLVYKKKGMERVADKPSVFLNDIPRHLVEYVACGCLFIV